MHSVNAVAIWDSTVTLAISGGTTMACAGFGIFHFRMGSRIRDLNSPPGPFICRRITCRTRTCSLRSLRLIAMLSPGMNQTVAIEYLGMGALGAPLMIPTTPRLTAMLISRHCTARLANCTRRRVGHQGADVDRRCPCCPPMTKNICRVVP